MMKWRSVGNGQLAQITMQQISNTLDCMHDAQAVLGGGMMNDRKYVLRRLTPIECLRLQGYPDWWCEGANGSDSAIYKAAGNSLAIPCATDVIGRIVRFVEQEKKENK